MEIIPTGRQTRLHSLIAFIEKLEKSVAPAFIEFYSTETKSARNILTGFSFIIILVCGGAVVIKKLEVGLAPIKIEFSFGTTFFYAGAFVILFLLAGYLSRCYVDWQAWRLKKLRADAEVLLLFSEIHDDVTNNLSLRAGIQNEMVELMKTDRYGNKILELTDKLVELTEGDDAALINQRLDHYHAVISSAIAVRKIRLWLELVFPTLFALAAIASTFQAR